MALYHVELIRSRESLPRVAASCGELRQAAANCGELRQSAAWNPNKNTNKNTNSKEKKKQKELHIVKQITSSGERTVNGTVLCIGDRVVKGQGKRREKKLVVPGQLKKKESVVYTIIRGTRVRWSSGFSDRREAGNLRAGKK